MLSASDLIQTSAALAELKATGLSTRAVHALVYGCNARLADMLADSWGEPPGLRRRLERTPNCGPKTLAEIEAKRAQIIGRQETRANPGVRSRK